MSEASLSTQTATDGLVQSKPRIALIDATRMCLHDSKAEDIVQIEIGEKSSLADFMVVASGRSHRHVGAIADQLSKSLRDLGFGKPHIEGAQACDWVLIDAGDVIVHVFRPEVREFYKIEKMWSADFPSDSQ